MKTKLFTLAMLLGSLVAFNQNAAAEKGAEAAIQKEAKQRDELGSIEQDFNRTIKNLRTWISLSSFSTIVFYFFILFSFCNKQLITIFLFLSCLMAGILGSSIAAFISTLQRYGDGIEFGDGRKYPISLSQKIDMTTPKQTYNIRFANFLRSRPILGVYTGFLVYFGSSFFINEQINEDKKLIFVSLLCGFFAKILLEKMKSYFERIIGKVS